MGGKICFFSIYTNLLRAICTEEAQIMWRCEGIGEVSSSWNVGSGHNNRCYYFVRKYALLQGCFCCSEKAMGTNIRFSTAFHPQTSGQVERVNQIFEDMLRACVISFGMKWEDCLPYAEFSYNNSFQASSGKAPFEILHVRKCRTPLNWSETGERQVLGNDFIRGRGNVQSHS